MMNSLLKQVAGAGVLALVFTLGAGTSNAAPLAMMQGYGQGPGYGPGGPSGWDQPPGDYRDDIQRQGFHDGIEGARKDVENHRRPTPNNRDEYRHPNVPGPARRAYREAFRRGYQVAMSHMAGGPRPY